MEHCIIIFVQYIYITSFQHQLLCYVLKIYTIQTMGFSLQCITFSNRESSIVTLVLLGRIIATSPAGAWRMRRVEPAARMS